LLALVGILLAACQPAQPSDPVAIVQAAYDRLNQDDIDGYMKLLSDDVVMIDGSGRIDGPQAIRENLALNFVPWPIRFELSDLSSDGNVVTYTIKIYEDDTLVATYDDGLTIVVDGKIIFDGQDRYRSIECNQDPSQAFCPGN
jgi:ketosteroid isomerase-like protein